MRELLQALHEYHWTVFLATCGLIWVVSEVTARLVDIIRAIRGKDD